VINKQLVLFLIPFVIPYRALQILDPYWINEDIKLGRTLRMIDPKVISSFYFFHSSHLLDLVEEFFSIFIRHRYAKQ